MESDFEKLIIIKGSYYLYKKGGYSTSNNYLKRFKVICKIKEKSTYYDIVEGHMKF